MQIVPKLGRYGHKRQEQPSHLVMIVGTDRLQLKLLETVFGLKGCRTLRMSPSQDVVTTARRHHPSLLVLSCGPCPDAGLELVEWLRDDEKLCDLPIVAITGTSRLDAGGTCPNTQCDVFLVMPFRISVLTDIAEKLFDDHHGVSKPIDDMPMPLVNNSAISSRRTKIRR
ncbi:MAG: hypothetical protein ACR2PG_22455 [Hyphomicrobiaceae bacterium]